MQRVFTSDIGRNFRKGDVRDYPVTVWRDIERSAKRELDAFSAPVMNADQSQMMNPDLMPGKKK